MVTIFRGSTSGGAGWRGTQAWLSSFIKRANRWAFNTVHVFSSRLIFLFCESSYKFCNSHISVVIPNNKGHQHFILVGSGLEYSRRSTAWVLPSLSNVNHHKTLLHLYYLAGLSGFISGKQSIMPPSFKAIDTQTLGRRFQGRDAQITRSYPSWYPSMCVHVQRLNV